MSAGHEYEFGEYRLRPARQADMELAMEWTLADPEHRHAIAPTFWLEQVNGRDSFLLTDRDGPIMFFKMHLTKRDEVRIFMQFKGTVNGGRCHTREEMEAAKHLRERTRRALTMGMDWLEEMLKKNGVREVFFDSASRTLIRFTTKRLGFKQDGPWLRKMLERRKPVERT
jgi:hypothetical protein